MQIVRITVEVPRGGFVKRDAAGHLDLASPLPSPFTYGRIDGILSGDGEPQDAIVLAGGLKRGEAVELPVQTVARFVDGGERDDKWICKATPVTRIERAVLSVFFRAYTVLKNSRDRLRTGRPASRFEGWSPPPQTNPATSPHRGL